MSSRAATLFLHPIGSSAVCISASGAGAVTVSRNGSFAELLSRQGIRLQFEQQGAVASAMNPALQKQVRIFSTPRSGWPADLTSRAFHQDDIAAILGLRTTRATTIEDGSHRKAPQVSVTYQKECCCRGWRNSNFVLERGEALDCPVPKADVACVHVEVIENARALAVHMRLPLRLLRVSQRHHWSNLIRHAQRYHRRKEQGSYK